jgi:uncharacterized membrane-anchored protein
MMKRWRGQRGVCALALGVLLTAGAAAADPPASKGAGTAGTPTGTAAPGGTDAPAGSEDAPVLSEKEKAFRAIPWQTGPIDGSLGDIAAIQVPAGVTFTEGAGTRRFLELNQNPTNGSELGMIASDDFRWVVIFEFSDIGHVKDDEKAELDAEAILGSLREGNVRGNEMRRSRGWHTVTLLGWASSPRYDEITNNLEWGTKIQDDVEKNITVNHSIRLLGRDGVMEVNVLVGPEEYASSLAAVKEVLKGYSFKAGHRYQEWRPGERVAAIGLTGLITGGAIAAAGKAGVLGKMGKGLGKLIAAGAAGLAALGAKLFGRKKDGA